MGGWAPQLCGRETWFPILSSGHTPLHLLDQARLRTSKTRLTYIASGDLHQLSLRSSDLARPSPVLVTCLYLLLDYVTCLSYCEVERLGSSRPSSITLPQLIEGKRPDSPIFSSGNLPPVLVRRETRFVYGLVWKWFRIVNSVPPAGRSKMTLKGCASVEFFSGKCHGGGARNISEV